MVAVSAGDCKSSDANCSQGKARFGFTQGECRTSHVIGDDFSSKKAVRRYARSRRLGLVKVLSPRRCKGTDISVIAWILVDGREGTPARCVIRLLQICALYTYPSWIGGVVVEVVEHMGRFQSSVLPLACVAC